MKKVQIASSSIQDNAKIGNALLENFSQPTTLLSGGLLFLVALCAIFAPLIAPTNPYNLAVVSIMAVSYTHLRAHET